MWIHFGFRSSDSVSDADWRCKDSLSAPLFARLSQLHSFKQMLLFHPEHCPNCIDSITNGLVHWCLSIVVDRHVDCPHDHLVCCFGSGPVQIIVPHLRSSRRWTSTFTFHQLHSFCSIPVHGNTFNSCGTRSLLGVPLLLFQQVDWWRHMPSHSRILMETHSFLSCHLGDKVLPLLVICSRHTTSSSHGDTHRLIQPTPTHGDFLLLLLGDTLNKPP